MLQNWVPTIGAITLFEDDLAEAKAFYQRVFDTPPRFEDSNSVAFNFGSTTINLLKTTAAHDLIAPARVGTRQSGVYGELTISVDDVDAVCAHLRDVGVALLNGPTNRPIGVRTAAFEDPSGHVWEVSQDLPSRFMLLLRVPDGLHLSESERSAMHEGLDAWRADLTARGALVMESELLGGPSAREVRMRNGAPEVHSGRSVREAEPVTGFVIVECATLEEAVAIALRTPVAAFGTVEVRPFGF